MVNSKVFRGLMVFSIVSSLTIGLALILYVLFHDQVFITLQSIATDMASNGFLQSWAPQIIETFLENMDVLVNVIDKLWAIDFILFIGMAFFTVYRDKRRGYFDLLSFLTYGVFVLLFVLSIFNQFNNFIYNLFFNTILQNLLKNLVFFDLYINNFLFINAIIIVGLLVVNFIDLDFSKFKSRKIKEVRSDEV